MRERVLAANALGAEVVLDLDGERLREGGYEGNEDQGRRRGERGG